MEPILQGFRDRIAVANADGKPLRIVGGASKDWYGNALTGEAFDVSAWRGIVHYDPTELVITARCGTPLTEIEAALAQHGQMLAFEPPHFGATATIGGTVACGLSGPRRQAAGATRDFILGAVLMDAKGELLHFGGQVMKNVAGYDVSRLIAGSWGVLGVICEVSLKVLAAPADTATLEYEWDEPRALEEMARWRAQPVPLQASAWCGSRLRIRLAGSRAAVLEARTRLGGAAMDREVASGFWESVRDQRHEFFAAAADQLEQGTALWRLSVPSTAKPFSLAGRQFIEWGGAQRWWRTAAPAAQVRAAAASAGGHATLVRSTDKSAGAFAPLGGELMRIHRALKTAFDPERILNPGRLYADL